MFAVRRRRDNPHVIGADAVRILVVEDELKVAQALRTGLEAQQYQVALAATGEEGFFLVNSQYFDLIILDLMLPGRDGLDVLGALRKCGFRVPVLMLTARDAVEDRVLGLDSGADDYLVKPIDLDELAARARALARRSAGRAVPLIEHGSLSVDPAAHKVMVDGAAVDLSTREFAILEALLDNAGRVLTRAQLETHVYGWTAEPDSNAVEVHIHHLRRKLGGNLIKTLRGVGYMIDKLS